MENFAGSAAQPKYVALTISSLADLETALIESGLDISSWSHEKGVKSTTDLWREVESGECQLVRTNEGKIIRVVTVMTVEVRAQFTDQNYRLQEYRRFDGSSEPIRRQIETSLGEKLLATEDPNSLDLLYRTLKEELDVDLHPQNIRRQNLKPRTKQRTSRSFPGLNSLFSVYSAEIELFGDQIKDKYIEHQPEKGKTNIFVWEKLAEN